MEQAARAAGIAAPYDHEDADPETGNPTEQHYTSEVPRDADATFSTSRARSNTAASRASSQHTNRDRVPIPLSARRSFSTGRRTPAASVRSRAGSTFTMRTQERPDVPPTPTFGVGYVLAGGSTTHVNGPAAIGPETGPIGQAITTDGADGGDEEDEEEDDGPPWDSLHPCWPHLNPHVPLSSAEYSSTRIIRLQRDYRTAGDLYPQIVTAFPEILEPWLSQAEFKAFVGPLNGMLKEVFDPSGGRHWVDAAVGLATGWLWDDLGLNGVKKGFRRLENWMQQWNENVGKARGVSMISLRRTAFLCLDVQVPDPSGFIEREGEDGEGVNGHVVDGEGLRASHGYGATTDGGTSVVGGTEGYAETEAETGYEYEGQSEYATYSQSQGQARSEQVGTAPSHDGTFFISGNMGGMGPRRDEGTARL